MGKSIFSLGNDLMNRHRITHEDCNKLDLEGPVSGFYFGDFVVVVVVNTIMNVYTSIIDLKVCSSSEDSSYSRSETKYRPS
jgi:hypothetical protein